MASIYKVKNKGFYCKLTLPNRKIVRFAVGNISKRNADRLRDKMDTLLLCVKLGFPLDESMEKWVVSIAGTKLSRNLVKHGLLQNTSPQEIEPFISEYIKMRQEIKASSRTAMITAKNRIVDFFGANTLLHKIHEGDAERFRGHLLTKFSKATAGRTLVSTIQYFDHAVRCRLIQKNPFKGLKVPKQVNKDRKHFVDKETAQKVINALPRTLDKLIFALARFGGLRIPSEVHRMRWDDIDWENGKILVRSPKTEHHEGKDKRVIPLFPEIREILQVAYAERDPSAELVFRAIKGPAVHLRTRILKVMKEIGMPRWPKLFVNLRSSCETELVERFPLHVVTEWIGHTPQIAQAHYLQLLNSHWQNAISGSSTLKLS